MILLEKYKQEIANKVFDILKDHISASNEDVFNMIERPKNDFGDFSIPMFRFSKELKKNPAMIASEVSEKLNFDYAKSSSTGPFININFDEDKVSREFLELLDFKFESKDKKVVIEYPSPNTNKPLHIGHLRNMLLGNSVSNILEENGFEVIRTNLINDRGIHICKSMLAYQKWGDSKSPETEGKKGDHLVGDFYVKFAKEVKKDPSLDEQAKKMLQKWESGDKETLDLWKMMNSWALLGMDETYKRLDIKFDKLYFESEIYERGRNIVLDAYKKGIVKRNEDGAYYVPLEDYNLPDKIILRSDGTTTYATQDIALIKEKLSDFDSDGRVSKSILCVGSEQETYLEQMFKIFEILGIDKKKRSYHMSYGMVNLPDGKMKSREGNVVDIDDLVDDVVEFEKKELQNRYDDLSEEELKERSEIIGIGAMRFFMLKFDAKKDISFNKEESLKFEGETGPYVQYTYSRIKSILRKASTQGIEEDKLILSNYKITSELDFKLIKKGLEYYDFLKRAARDFNPAHIAHYLIELSQSINEYYNKNHVMDEKEDVKISRLILLKKMSNILKNGLKTLDIKTLEVM